jgi:hypothetical protein
VLSKDVSERPRLALGPETHWPFEMAQVGTAMATFSFNVLTSFQVLGDGTPHQDGLAGGRRV